MLNRVLRKVFVIWCVFLWGMHVYNLNQAYNCKDTYYNIGDTFEIAGLKFEPMEHHIYEKDEYIARFGDEKISVFDEYEGDIRILCLQVKVTNKTNEDLEWEGIITNFGYGFESSIWCSSNIPVLSAQMNHFSSEFLASNTSDYIWFATIISGNYFREKYWEKIDDIDFYYVVSLQPDRVRIIINNN